MPKQGIANAERRKSNRHILSAAAEVLDVTSGARMAVRVADLSFEGCYVDSINSLPEGSRVRLRIRRNESEFNGAATVRYVQSGMGMGLAFINLDDVQKELVRGWIHTLSAPPDANGRPADSWSTPEPKAAKRPESTGLQAKDAIVLRLIALLQQRGTLSASDAAALIDPDGRDG